MRFRTLIIGLGNIGMGYDLNLDTAAHIYSHARAFSLHPDFHLIGGIDPAPQKRNAFEHSYGCPAYANIDDALLQHQPDLVVVAVPTEFHKFTLRKVLEKPHPPRAILCEKPLSYDIAEARSMVQECAEKKIGLYVNYIRRSDPGAIEIKRRLDNGEIATPIKGVVWYSKGFLHNGSHFFNLLEYWLGAMEEFSILDRGRLWNDIDPEPDVRVSFGRGSIVFLAAREENFSHYTVELLARNGRLRYEEGGSLIQWQKTVKHSEFRDYTVLGSNIETIVSGMNRYQWHVAEQLSKALEGKEVELSSGRDALNTLERMKRILEEV